MGLNRPEGYLEDEPVEDSEDDEDEIEVGGVSVLARALRLRLQDVDDGRLKFKEMFFF